MPLGTLGIHIRGILGNSELNSIRSPNLEINSFPEARCALLPQVERACCASPHPTSCCEPGSRGAVHRNNMHSYSRNVVWMHSFQGVRSAQILYAHNANMKSTVVWFLLLAALLCASNSESRATDADGADVAAVTPIDLDVDGNTQITLSSEEELLYNLIMEYRKENGLPPIPLSKSLTFVAQTHAKDLDTPGVVTGICNGHSWSANGNWKSCCYTANHKQAQCVWDKPRELTCVSDKPPELACYRGNGYEIATGYTNLDGSMNAKDALISWKGSPGHNAAIVNGGPWGRPWKAIGVGISRHFATVWFGHEAESEFSSPPPSTPKPSPPPRTPKASPPPRTPKASPPPSTPKASPPPSTPNPSPPPSTPKASPPPSTPKASPPPVYRYPKENAGSVDPVHNDNSVPAPSPSIAARKAEVARQDEQAVIAESRPTAQGEAKAEAEAEAEAEAKAKAKAEDEAARQAEDADVRKEWRRYRVLKQALRAAEKLAASEKLLRAAGQHHRTSDDDDGDRRPSLHEFRGARRHHHTYDDDDFRRPSLHRRERDSHRRRVIYRRSDLPQPCRNERIYHEARHSIQICISVLQKQLRSSELALELM